MSRTCPKCLSSAAWVAIVDYDVVLRCFCGLYKIIATSLNMANVADNETENEYEELKLPKRDTHLWATLMVLTCLESASSAEVTQRLQEFGRPKSNTSDVASYLTILKSKGMVRTTEVRRGTLGGSTWMLTDRAIFLIGV